VTDPGGMAEGRMRHDDEVPRPNDEPDEAPATPTDEPQPAPVRDPPAEPDRAPYVVRAPQPASQE